MKHKRNNFKNKLTIITILSIFMITTISLSLKPVEAFNSEITYMDTTYFNPDINQGADTKLYVNLWDSNGVNIAHYDKADNAIRVSFPSTMTFLESEFDNITVNQTYMTAQMLAEAPVYYVASIQRFTFKFSYYNIAIKMQDMSDSGYNVGYNAGYAAGYAAGNTAGNSTGKIEMYARGSAYYGFDETKSFDYTRGSTAQVPITENRVIQDIYNNGITFYSSYLQPGQSLANSHDFVAGIASVSGESAYEQGYLEGSKSSFMAKLDVWIVPAIIIVLIGGGFVTFALRKRE